MGLFDWLFGRRVDIGEVLCDIEIKQKMAEALSKASPDEQARLLAGMSEKDKRDVLANLNEQLGIKPLKPPAVAWHPDTEGFSLRPYVEDLPVEDQPHAERMLTMAQSTAETRTVPAAHYITLLSAMVHGNNCDENIIHNFLIDTIDYVQRDVPPTEGTVTSGR